MLVASSGRDGRVTISPKGDPAGFVRVLDDKRLAIPDRLGNRRADTFQNLFENPHVGLIFLIPGKAETLRVNGEARLVRDAALLESMAVNGRVPNLAMVVYRLRRTALYALRKVCAPLEALAARRMA
jgi:predicted pyridoxine 5'-phosphate oxidase superfamily flavin-nucleotide-binding protein